MKIQEVIKDRLDALDSQSRNTSSLTTNTAREIVEETMKYYTLCKDKESKYIGKNMNVGFVTGFTAVPTLGASAPVGIGTMAYNTFMCSKWEELKERSKEVRTILPRLRVVDLLASLRFLFILPRSTMYL